MKSKSSAKSKNNKEIDNKKPPTKETTQNEKNEEPEKKENEITEEIEKQMLEGQEHIEEANPEPPKVEEEKPKERKQMLIKPRETYLQEKISKMNCNRNLMSNIQKELGDKVKTVIKDENVLITEVPRDLGKFMQRVESKSGKNIFQNYMNKQKYKEVKKLNDELSAMRKNYLQLEENEKLLQDEGFAQANI